MSKRLLFVLSLLAVLSAVALFGAPLTAQAQGHPATPPPQRPGVHPAPVMGGNGIVRGADGVWRGRVRAARNPNVVSADTGGPDKFGYTWDDSVAFSWIDATDGTDAGLGSEYGESTDAIPLPFAFKFYEHTYDAVYINPFGYLGFASSTWQTQMKIPSPVEPNNIIAPYAAPLHLSDTGPEGRVYYKTGGTAPNRYFVVEWYKLAGEGDNQFTFEAILYENGDIVFQYDTMNYANGYFCGSGGIEDDTGLDGLTYISYCNMAPSQKAVRFYRPAPSPRVKVLMPYKGAFFTPGETKTFQFTVRNSGESGADTYNITVNSSWTVALYAADGTTPLSDTNDDGIVDTGAIDEGDDFTFTASVTAPSDAQPVADGTVTLTLTSSLDSSHSAEAKIQNTVPAPFAQAFSDGADPNPAVLLVRPDNQQEVTPAESGAAWDRALYQTPSGFFYTWDASRQISDDTWVEEIYYAILDHAGTVITTDKLTDLSGATYGTYDIDMHAAVTPNGYIGVVWRRWADVENLYFAVLKADSGEIVAGPRRITSNASSDQFFAPSIAATANGRFVVVWTDTVWGTGSSSEVEYAVLNTAGNFVHAPTQLDSAFPWAVGVVTANTSANQVAVFYTDDSSTAAAMVVLDSSGNIVHQKTTIDSMPFAWLDDALLLPNGNIVVAWRPSNLDSPLLNLTALDANGNVAVDTVSVSHPLSGDGPSGASLTIDIDGHLLVTWANDNWYYRKHLFYAAFDAATLEELTPPMIFMEDSTGIDIGWSGQSNTTYLTFGDVSYTYWAADWIERLYKSGITSGCGEGVYCPDETVTRAQMAVFLERGIHGSDYTPPNVEHSSFGDVSDTFWAKNWIEALYNDGVTSGCGNGNYCPGGNVTRAQMAVFLLRAEHGSDYTPPQVEHSRFNDVPDDFWAKDWIEQLAEEGITSGCGDGSNYCPGDSVTRAQMAVFLVRAFNLP